MALAKHAEEIREKIEERMTLNGITAISQSCDRNGETRNEAVNEFLLIFSSGPIKIN